jgi:hypothetical protein
VEQLTRAGERSINEPLAGHATTEDDVAPICTRDARQFSPTHPNHRHAHDQPAHAELDDIA